MAFSLASGSVDATADLDELRTRQHDVLRRDQLLEFVERSKLTSSLRLERWQSPHQRVVVLHNGPLTLQQKLWAAVLAAPDGSALAGATAAELDGFQLPVSTDGRVEVVVPQGSRPIPLPWVRTRWSTYLDGEDVHPLSQPRRTRLPRSTLDLASDQRAERDARTVLFAAVQQRLVTPRHLDEALDRRGPCRHHGVVVETLIDLGGGIQSVPEREFDALVRSRRLPTPTRQRILRRPGGRYYLDAAWDAYRLAVEVDGSQHLDPRQWDVDVLKAADVVANGWRLLRVTSWLVRHERVAVGDRLERALVTGGWIRGS